MLYAVAAHGKVSLEVLDSLCCADAAMALDVNAQGISNWLCAMTALGASGPRSSTRCARQRQRLPRTAKNVSNTLLALAETSGVLPEVFESLCWAAVAKMQDSNARNVANMLWAMAEISWVLPEVFDSLCRAVAAKVQDFDAQNFAALPGLFKRYEGRWQRSTEPWIASS